MGIKDVYDQLLKARKEDWLHDDEKGTHVLQTNVLIWLEEERAYGEDARRDRDFQEDWTRKFPDPKASRHPVRLHYGAVPLERFHMVVVDGGRATLPMPDIGDMTVEPIKYAIAIGLDLRAGREDLEGYMKRAGMRVK